MTVLARPSNHQPPKIRFHTVLPSSTHTAQPRPYRAGLHPRASPFRPHCLARDRLKLWRPFYSRVSKPIDSGFSLTSEDDLERILVVMAASWAPGTRDTYGAGILVYHVFCDTRNISEIQRCPASTSLLLMFISACAGSYSGASVANYIYAVRAWHTLHGATWPISKVEITAALDGAAVLAPPSSKRPRRAPFTVELLVQLRSGLDLNSPLDAAIFACLTTSFWSMARLGEFTVPSLKSFDIAKHITRGRIREDFDRRGRRVRVFALPWTKVAPTGEDVYWSKQDGMTDPSDALDNHFRVNNPPMNIHLFSWRHPSGWRPLTRSAFTKRLDTIAISLHLPKMHYHGLRIGSVLEYLLREVPFDAVKSMGRWSSNSFALYLREHAVVLAPYIQASSAMEEFTRLTIIPPVR